MPDVAQDQGAIIRFRKNGCDGERRCPDAAAEVAVESELAADGWEPSETNNPHLWHAPGDFMEIVWPDGRIWRAGSKDGFRTWESRSPSENAQ